MPAATHGLSNKHPLYGTWKSIRTRCNNPNATSYKNYGAKGVKICERWNDFLLFIKDMGEKPGSNYQVDRKDNSGDYEPSNVRWATREQQNVNQRPKGATGRKGVYVFRKAFTARTCKYHGRRHLGVFATIEAAAAAIAAYGCTYNEQ